MQKHSFELFPLFRTQKMVDSDLGNEENTPIVATTQKAPPKCAVWCTADDVALVSALTAKQAAGNQADNGWKPVVWTAAAVALRGSEL
jgi:hypothetical protein